VALNGLFCAGVPLRNYPLTEKKAKDRQTQHELEKTRLAFKQELERSKLTLQQCQEEKRERHRSELER